MVFNLYSYINQEAHFSIHSYRIQLKVRFVMEILIINVLPFQLLISWNICIMDRENAEEQLW